MPRQLLTSLTPSALVEVPLGCRCDWKCKWKWETVVNCNWRSTIITIIINMAAALAHTHTHAHAYTEHTLCAFVALFACTCPLPPSSSLMLLLRFHFLNFIHTFCTHFHFLDAMFCSTRSLSLSFFSSLYLLHVSTH